MSDYDGCAISFGAGVNSVAMTIMLVNEGWRGPVVFAETGCEWPETYSYMEMFEREWLGPRGLSVTRLGAEWRKPSKQVSLLEYCENKLIFPSFGHRWCTHDWKRGPIARWQRAKGIGVALIGIAADESQRAHDGMECPLCDRLIDRDGCRRIIDKAGLPIPPKSGCVMCFFQPIEQWRLLWERHPAIFQRICRLDDALLGRVSVDGQKKRAYSILMDNRGENLPLRTLAAGFAAQGTLPGLDVCDAQHLRCWACMT